MRKLKFKALALALMLASLAAITWLDTPAYAACSESAYGYCTGQCDRERDSCIGSSGGNLAYMLACNYYHDNCTCDCSRACFGPSPACPAN